MKMRTQLETPWWFFIGGTVIALVILVVYNVFGVFNNPPICTQLSLGLVSGLLLGIGIIGLLRTHWWQVNSRSIMHFILILWQVFFLAFTTSSIFTIVRENIANHNDFFQSYYILQALCREFKATFTSSTTYWYIDLLILFSLCVWILLLWNDRNTNKYKRYYSSKKIPWLFVVFNAICIGFLLLLYFVKIDSYYFFFINTGDSSPDPNPFLFYLLIGTFGVVFLGTLLYPFLNKLMNHIQKRQNIPYNYDEDFL